MIYQQIVHNSLIGSGGHSASLSTLFQLNNIKINNIVSNEPSPHWPDCSFFKCDDEFKTAILPENTLMYLGIVGIPGSKLKERLIKVFSDYTFPNVISPYSVVFSELPKNIGVQIFHHSIVNKNAQIGNHTVINNASIIEHDVIIGRNVHLAPRSTICGNVIIGDNVFVGAGAIVKNGIHIAANTVIGMGAIVVHDINVPGIYVGSPAKKVN